jgi:hypothetical protein
MDPLTDDVDEETRRMRQVLSNSFACVTCFAPLDPPLRVYCSPGCRRRMEHRRAKRKGEGQQRLDL